MLVGKVKHITPPPRASLGTIGKKSPKTNNKTFSDEKNHTHIRRRKINPCKKKSCVTWESKTHNTPPQGQSWGNWEKRVQKQITKPLATKKIIPYKKKKNHAPCKKKSCVSWESKTHNTPQGQSWDNWEKESKNK